jgi:cell division protein FtsI/penicillin-binding protein 2
LIMKQLLRENKNNQRKFSEEKNWRIYGLASFVLFIGICIIGKLYFLQILRYQTYRAIADSQHQSTTKLQAKRGEIYLKNNSDLYPLAVNKEMQMVYAVPREMTDAATVAKKISEILGLDSAMVQEKLGDPNDMFEILKHKLSEDEVAKVREAKLSGIYLQGESFRFYPSGELASQLVGFVGSNGEDQKGMYGLEAYWEKTLKGESGLLKQEGDSQGRWIPMADRNLNPAQDGPDLVLTIDHTVQFEVEKILKEAVAAFRADSGTIIVGDPKTGKILAIANAPSFDPNNFSKVEDISAFSNPAISQPYESGSVFKAFTEAIGIDSGKISANTTYTDTGIVKEAGYDIQNSDLKANGVQTMTEVLEKSLNTGVIYIEKLVGNKVFADYVKRFGFGEKTGIDLPGELGGNILNLNNPKTTINFYTAAFGQGITVTPLQLLSGYSALANGGVLMKPYVVEEKRFSDGKVEKTEPQEIRQVISKDAANETAKMLRSVVVNGHGKRADVPGYLVCGKTGTAQVSVQGEKGYAEGMNIGSFAGFAPLNDPQFTMVVKIVNPRDIEWAESSAAPTFGKVMKFLLEYNKVKPTEDPSTSPIAKYPPYAFPNVNKKDSEPNKEIEKKDEKKKQEKTKDGSKIITSGD